MKPTKRTWKDNLREAFFLKLNVPLFGKIPLNFISFAGLCTWGFFDPSMFFIALPLEATYLVMMSGSKYVTKSLSEQESRKRKEAWESKKIQLLNKLSPSGRARFRQLENMSRNIFMVYETAVRDGSYIDPVKLNIANQLMWLALKLLTSKESMIRNIKGNTKDMLEIKISNMEKNLEKEASEKLKKTLESTILTMKKRLETIETLNEKVKEIDLELLRIEEQLAFVHSIMTIDLQSSGANLSQQIDMAQNSITEADEWMKTNTELFGSLEAEFTELPPEGVFVSTDVTT